MILFNDFCIDLLDFDQLGSNLAPKTRQDGARNRLRGTQNRVKTVLGSENSPELDFRSTGIVFLMDFGWIFNGFGMDTAGICDGFLDGFGMNAVYLRF